MARIKNPGLKKAGEECTYTSDQIGEMGRCIERAEYFLDTFCQIQHATRGAIPFKLFPYQRRVVNAFQDHRLTVTLAPRQIGKCLVDTTELSTCKFSIINNSTIRKCVLWLFNRKVYNELFHPPVRSMQR